MIYYLYVFYPHVLLNKTCVGLSTNFDLTSLYIIDIDRKKVIQHQIFQRILMKPSENSNDFEFIVLI